MILLSSPDKIPKIMSTAIYDNRADCEQSLDNLLESFQSIKNSEADVFLGFELDKDNQRVLIMKNKIQASFFKCTLPDNY
tara:strand:- start:349 stop:588 length:240 start_codon:yes stop_codon:yes gene_type:complete